MCLLHMMDKTKKRGWGERRGKELSGFMLFFCVFKLICMEYRDLWL